MPAAPSLVLALKSRTGSRPGRGLEKVPEDWMEGSTLFFPQSTGLLLLRVPVRSIVHTNCSLSPFRLDFLNPDKRLAVWMHRLHCRGRCLTRSSLRIQAHNITNNYTGLFAFPMPHINVRSNDLQLRLIS